MIKIRSSLRWQLQLYYFVILLITLAILTGLSIHWMRESELFKYDSRLRDVQRFLIPILVGHGPASEDLFRKAPQTRSYLGHRERGMTPGGRPPLFGFPPPRGREGRPRPEGGPPSDGRPPRRRPPPPGFGGRDEEIRKMMKEGWCFSAWTEDGTMISASINFPDFLKPDIYPDNHQEALVRNYKGYRQLLSRTPHSCIVIAYPLGLLDADARERAGMIIAFSSTLLVISTSIGWVLIGRALRPLKVIEETADEIAKGQLSRRIPQATQSRNEIGELAENLNRTFGRLEALFERQVRFTSDASHELRTPIAVILNHCQYGLAKERTSEEYRQALKACLRAGDRMINLTSSLLELSRLESGEIDLGLTPCSLGEVAEEALELVEPLAADKGVVLRDEIQDFTINANADRIWQVIVNLLNNAIRHTPSEKSVTLRTERDGDQIKISVIDEGEGIPEESIPHLFDRFYRVDTARSRLQKEGGFGLGLAICDTIIKAHGGSIQVDSIPGVRTHFVIRLPA